MSEARAKILCVDDEPYLLEALRRQLFKRFEAYSAASGALALQLIESHGPFAVVVSDMRMPQMNGAQLLAAVRERAPDTSRILLTGHTELDTAIAAVNDGQIFRFLCKPCEPAQLRCAVEAGVEQHALRRAQQDLLENTLRGTIDALGEVLALACPLAFGRVRGIQAIAVALAQASGVTDVWQVEVAALLSQLGAVTLPTEVLERWASGELLLGEGQAMVDRLPAIAETLLHRIPRLERVREIIRRPGERLAPLHDRSTLIEAHILRMAVELDQLRARGMSGRAALQALHDEGSHDPALLEHARLILRQRESAAKVHSVELSMLTAGMVVDEDVRDQPQGTVLIARGHVVGESLLIRLRNLGARPGLPEFVRVVGP